MNILLLFGLPGHVAFAGRQLASADIKVLGPDRCREIAFPPPIQPEYEARCEEQCLALPPCVD
jgi:hypothetical protein